MKGEKKLGINGRGASGWVRRKLRRDINVHEGERNSDSAIRRTKMKSRGK